MRLLVFALASLLLATPPLAADDASGVVTLLHFSDYHSHAVPFFSEGKRSQGGIARAIAYLRAARKRPRSFVFSGGDTVNKGSPAWSDKYGCAEWPWFNGIVDAMAFGNHDGDYGTAAFRACRASATYPILGSNVTDANGGRVFDVGGKPYIVVARDGVRVGVFALAGDDFNTLVKPASRPAEGAVFTDRIAAARDVVKQLRENEHVDLVVLIGHEHRDQDEALAHAVPGIDIIFGSHSHIKEALHQFPGTSTWYVSPYQYLTYISRLEVKLVHGKVQSVRGRLVAVDSTLREDRDVARRVASMQAELERDPTYAPLFRVIGSARNDLLLTDSLRRSAPLAARILNVARDAAHADLALSTASSFRQPLARGPIRFEDLRATLPYPNNILVFEMSGAELTKLFALVEANRGTDSYLQTSTPLPRIEPTRVYRVATTDHLARIAAPYRDFFAGRTSTDTGLEVRDQVRRDLEAHSPW